MQRLTQNHQIDMRSKWTIAGPRCWLVGWLFLSLIPQAWGQIPHGSSSPQVPTPDQQPASPWSKPFRISLPIQQTPRHEMTQLDSLDEASSEDRVPGSTSSDLAPSKRRVQAILAARVSTDVLTPSDSSSGRSVQPLENPPGWMSVETYLRSSLDRCDHLLRRGAVHSSRQEAIGGLRHLFRTLDLHKRGWDSEPKLQQGLTALKESEDFERSQLTEPTWVYRLVQSHQTTILKEEELNSISPAIATQHYRAFARQVLFTASDGHPWAADLYYALGKTYEKEAQQQPERQYALLQNATICFQVAHAIDPSRSHIANQLGFNLLQMDKLGEAIVALNTAIASQPTSNAYLNLAEAYRRVGHSGEMQLALQQASNLKVQETRYSPENPEITEISPEDFAKISPPATGYEKPQVPSKVASRPGLPTSMR